MQNSLLDGYAVYAKPSDIVAEAISAEELGNVGTSITVSVTYSASVSWTFTWSA